MNCKTVKSEKTSEIVKKTVFKRIKKQHLTTKWEIPDETVIPKIPVQLKEKEKTFS